MLARRVHEAAQHAAHAARARHRHHQAAAALELERNAQVAANAATAAVATIAVSAIAATSFEANLAEVGVLEVSAKVLVGVELHVSFLSAHACGDALGFGKNACLISSVSVGPHFLNREHVVDVDGSTLFNLAEDLGLLLAVVQLGLKVAPG